jgi:tetrapyrrole methylase family protein/MazG family protein
MLSKASTEQAEAVKVALADAVSGMGPVGPYLLYVPPLPCAGSVARFQDTVAHLRAPDGCPWDREQTHRSLRQGFQEEAYEVLDALDRDDLHALQEELGDILLHVLLQVQIATEQGEFRLSDVICHVNDKIVYRHPHVFAGLEVDGVAEVLVNWEALKQQAKEDGEEAPSALAGIPIDMPALARAQSLQRHVDGSDVLQHALTDLAGQAARGVERLSATGQEAASAEAFGDLTFQLANLARALGIDAESALREANLRFEAQVRALEEGGQRGGCSDKPGPEVREAAGS